jgi:hypothetical protein
VNCQQANNAQFEQQLRDCNEVELLKAMLRKQRHDLLQAQKELRRYIERMPPPDWRALSATWTIGDCVRSQELVRG